MFVVIIFISIGFTFAYPLIVDRKLQGFDAVKLSFKAAMANFWRLLGMSILTCLLSVAGLLLCYVGMFLVFPIAYAAIATAYEQVFGLAGPGDIRDEPAAAAANVRVGEMAAPDLIIRGQRVVLPDAIAPRSIHIREERIVSVGDYDDVVDGCEVVEADDESVVMPGLVDTHVHINSPGRTEWEGFRSATLAAAAGGVTTLVDMPLNSIPPTTTLAGFKTKLDDGARTIVLLTLGFGEVSFRGTRRSWRGCLLQAWLGLSVFWFRRAWMSFRM